MEIERADSSSLLNTSDQTLRTQSKACEDEDVLFTPFPVKGLLFVKAHGERQFPCN